jgi:hypothetical protein
MCRIVVECIVGTDASWTPSLGARDGKGWSFGALSDLQLVIYPLGYFIRSDGCRTTVDDASRAETRLSLLLNLLRTTFDALGNMESKVCHELIRPYFKSN